VVLFLLSVAVWVVVLLRLRRHHLEPYRIEEYEPPPVEEPACPEAEPTPDCFTAAEIERLKALKEEYFAVIDAIEQEQADLKKEYQHASDKRRSAISSKLTSLASRHAAATRMFCGVESKIEKLYNGG
jgi:hypothetical protein